MYLHLFASEQSNKSEIIVYLILSIKNCLNKIPWNFCIPYTKITESKTILCDAGVHVPSKFLTTLDMY